MDKETKFSKKKGEQKVKMIEHRKRRKKKRAEKEKIKTIPKDDDELNGKEKTKSEDDDELNTRKRKKKT